MIGNYRMENIMKIIDCEFHYYLPELMEYLSTRDNAMRYYPETKILEVRDKVFAHFDVFKIYIFPQKRKT